jgi:hypothetical protein
MPVFSRVFIAFLSELKGGKNLPIAQSIKCLSGDFRQDRFLITILTLSRDWFDDVLRGKNILNLVLYFVYLWRSLPYSPEKMQD